MKVYTPLTIVAALTLSLFGMDVSAATPAIDVNINPTNQQVPHQATYYVQNPGTPEARKVYFFNKLDRNHDGQLSRSEIPKDMRYLRLHFIEADWNENGKLSPEEYVLYKRGQAPQYAGVFHAIVYVYSY
ncbi:MAG TPA: hypothetical protein VFL78_11960 [Rhodanobacteraceae bacterium]|nr:hypothetical protein [Rhodanobacteraceae bacterium]